MDRTGRFSVATLPFALLLSAWSMNASLRAQDPPPPAPPAAEKAQDPAAPAKPQSPLEALQSANAEQKPKALRAYIEDLIASNAIFAGQYSELRKIEGCEALVIEWIARPPQGVGDRGRFRTACVRASRDLVDKASEELLAKLNKIAAAGFESQDLREESAYALAQFGQREIVDAKIAEVSKALESEDPAQKAAAYQKLAEIRYNLREYAAAAEAYEGFLSLVEAGKFPIDDNARPTVLYNAACSHALAGQKEKAFGRLQNALDAWKKNGAIPRRLIETDMDIKSLREDEKFKALMATYLPPAVPKKSADGVSR